MRKQEFNTFITSLIVAIFSIFVIACSQTAQITLNDLNGTHVTIDQYKGKNILLYVFSLDCSLCADDIALLNSLNRLIKSDNSSTVIFLVNQTDTDIAIKKWIKKNNPEVQVVTDQNKTLQANLKYYPRGVPWSILVDPSGLAAKKKEGFFNNIFQLIEFVGYQGTKELDTNPPKISNINVDFNSDKMELTIAWLTDKETNEHVVITDNIGHVCYSFGNADKFLQNHKVVINIKEISPVSACDITIRVTDLLNNTTVIEHEKNYKLRSTTAATAQSKDLALPSVDGKVVSLNSYKGKKVFLHFWNYRCGTCQEELPLIKSLFGARPNNELEVVTVNIGGKMDALTSYVYSNGYTFPVLHDEKGASDKLFNLPGVPVSLLLDENGNVVKKHDGPFESLYEIREFAGITISSFSF